MNEPELLERLAQHDERALGEYVSLKELELLAFIKRQMSIALKAKIEPIDILQEVLITGLQQFPNSEFVTRTPFAWLCHLAEQRIIDAHRTHIIAQKRSAAREQGLNAGGAGESFQGMIDVLAVSITSPSQAFARGEKEWELQQALMQLTELERNIIKLRFVDKLSTREIAHQIGKSDGATRVILSRSLHQLHELLVNKSAMQSLLSAKENNQQ